MRYSCFDLLSTREVMTLPSNTTKGKRNEKAATKRRQSMSVYDDGKNFVQIASGTFQNPSSSENGNTSSILKSETKEMHLRVESGRS